MKYPKHRANIYLVQRELDGVVCGAFSTSEGADEFKGACEQDIQDKRLSTDFFKFYVSLGTYYET